ncbi:MAG: hypothetical protein M3417_10965, partial [Actinomycetota bacterium]|nr:hypothetical protein [Actinomycetota bacterium]
AGSARVLGRRVADPDGGPAWALRLSRTGSGLTCSTVGQERGGSFGLVGLDGRFRSLAEGVVDGCGPRRRNFTTLLGVRVFAAARRRDVRSVLYVVGGPELRSATVVTASGTRSVPLDGDHAGLYVLRTYPEDLGLQVDLRYADGHVERRALGRSPFVVTDPEGGPAYRTRVSGTGLSRTTCVSFAAARNTGSISASSPEVCGRLRGRPRGKTIGTGHFFAVRRITRSPKDRLGRAWRIAPRTAVWGLLGDDVRALVIDAPGRTAARLLPQPHRAVTLVLPGRVDPNQVRVRIEFTDGRSSIVSGDQNVLPTSRPFE